MEYRAEVSTVEGFVQQLAVSYVGRGYWFYVAGRVPEGKAPEAVDAKLISRYGIGISKWTRARRKLAGAANLQYLRHDRFFLLLATHGQHAFFDDEKPSIRDVRRVPIKFRGYSISHRGNHAHVRIEQEQYKELKSYFTSIALRSQAEALEKELGRLPFEPYAPIRRQLLCILRAVNRGRREAGLSAIESTCFRFKRRIVRPFEIFDDPAEPSASPMVDLGVLR